MNYKYLGVPVVLLAIFFLFATAQDASTSGAVSEGIGYEATVCISKNNELIGCQANTLTNGENVTRDLLGFGSGSAVDYIALATNETAVGPDNDALNNEVAGDGGERAQGTYSVNAGEGNWSIVNTFTATANIHDINATGLFNDSSGGMYFAGVGFASVDLNTNDQLTVNWTISIS